MAQFDVFVNADPAVRRKRPYLLILQHDRLSHAPTLIAAPLSRPQFIRQEPRLMPTLFVLGSPMVLVTQELSAVERRSLFGPPVDNREAERFVIMNALDVVFSAAG